MLHSSPSQIIGLDKEVTAVDAIPVTLSKTQVSINATSSRPVR
jgi:hypothetical protein